MLKVRAKVSRRTNYTTLFTCIKCFFTVSLVQREGHNTYQYGETCCKSCKVHVVPADHTCYMQPHIADDAEKK